MKEIGEETLGGNSMDCLSLFQLTMQEDDDDSDVDSDDDDDDDDWEEEDSDL